MSFIFETLSDLYPKTQYNILQNIENYTPKKDELKESKEVSFFFMECKSYLKILKFIIKKREKINVNKDVDSFEIPLDFDLIDHFLEIE